ncbi:MAG: folylpolyglutamate synthase/dihydrofolate synthase family protein [Marinicella sp.]
MKSLLLMTTHNSDPKQLLLNRLNELNQYKIDLGLERLAQVYERLKLDQYQPKIITVGGTNGKGSTVAALCVMLAVQGQTYGAFTSPHIFQFNERININGVTAADDEILEAFALIDAVRAEIELSYFEYAFLAAMLIFRKYRIDYAVLEVGLGGRLDATNVVDADVTIITTVDLDHMAWLGDDIETIAKEKAGIMRPNQPVIYGDTNTPKAILKLAEVLPAELLQFGAAYQITNHGSSFDYQYASLQYRDLPFPNLKGDWQLKNFAAALTAMLKLGFSFSHEQLSQVLNTWYVPGRMQTIQQNPLVIADVAHNRQSVQKLAQWLKANPIEGCTRAVFSVLGDKNLSGWIEQLDELIDHWFVFELAGQRAMSINELKITLADHVSLISVFESGQQAHQMALKLSESEDRIIIFGSFHVLDEVLRERPHH